MRRPLPLILAGLALVSSVALATRLHVTPARPIYIAVPDYPEDARAVGAEGVVVVSVIVDEAGDVSSARVVRSETIALLESAALDAAYASRFEPRRENGRPHEAKFQLPYRFPPPPRATIELETDLEFAAGDTVLIRAVFTVPESTELEAVLLYPGRSVGDPVATIAGTEQRALRDRAVWTGPLDADETLVISQRFVANACGSDSVVAMQPYMRHATLSEVAWPVCITPPPPGVQQPRDVDLSDPCCADFQ